MSHLGTSAQMARTAGISAAMPNHNTIFYSPCQFYCKHSRIFLGKRQAGYGSKTTERMKRDLPFPPLQSVLKTSLLPLSPPKTVAFLRELAYNKETSSVQARRRRFQVPCRFYSAQTSVIFFMGQSRIRLPRSGKVKCNAALIRHKRR